jgi:tRNA (adenine22-N1)-methyltransferase
MARSHLPSPVLDARLQAAADLIRAGMHADIGSDHAALPISLLHSRRAERVVIIEKTTGPLEVARQAVLATGLSDRAELRLGDGLAGLEPQELNSVSLTGMGQRTILGILERGRASGKQPECLVVQPNDGAGLLRTWAAGHGYWLVAERLASGFWRYPVLKFERRAEGDPVYLGLPHQAAIQYGPHLLRQKHPLLLQELLAQSRRLEALAHHARPQVLNDLNTVRAALRWLEKV